MKVTRIDGYHLKLVPPRPLGNARGFIRNREFLAVHLHTDAGTSGWGESFSSAWGAAALIKSLFARVVLGQPANDYGRLFNEMHALVNYDRRGVAMMAISALDTALHDAAARAQEMSVAQMLGGAMRRKVPAYASGPFIREGDKPYEGFEAEAEGYLQQGFRMLKPRIGVNPRADGAMIRAMRKTIGEEAGLMVDINQGYTAHAAIAAAREMEEANLLWMEEPVQPEDIAGYRRVSESIGIAVAGGEALGSPAAFRDFLEAGALSVLQPDMGVCGGFTGFGRIASLAAAYDLPVLPHVFSTTINFHAGLQAAALQPARKGGGPMHYPFVEYDPTGNPLMDLCGVPLGKDGHMALPDGPGLGITLTPAMLEPWTVERWSLSQP